MFIKIIYNAAANNVYENWIRHLRSIWNTEIFEKRLKFSEEQIKKILQTLVDTFGKYFIAWLSILEKIKVVSREFIPW